MNKPSERIVVFVTTAQKRAIATSAKNMGISVSELMRRAVLSFGATSEQVKAASIVDRLHAPRAPDALDAALQRVARGTRYAKAAQPASLQSGPGAPASTGTEKVSGAVQEETAVAPLLPADVLAALVAVVDEDAVATEAAVARVAAARAAQTLDTAGFAEQPLPAVTRASMRRTRIEPVAADDDEDDPRNDPTTEGGRFA